MRQGRKSHAAPALILLALLTAVPFTVSSSASASQLCADSASQPVLQDQDWHLIDPNLNYSDYTLQYVEPFVMKQGADFVMYVREELNSSSAIYKGTSLDGVSWTFGPSPVLQTGPSGSWDSATVFSPDVVWNGTGYMMYYVGDGGTTAQFRQIGVAFSTDGTHWTKYSGNPVITHGPGPYDARYTRAPSVVFGNGSYKMWYWGTSQINSSIPLQSSIDYATSVDGVHWTKSSDSPVFLGFTYSDNTTSSDFPSVVRVNGTYFMAFSAYTADLGLAKSADGIHWQFNNSTDLLLTTDGWHNGVVDTPSLLVDGNRILLWFLGYDNSNRSTPYTAGIGFASCGSLIALPAVTTTATTTATTTVTSTSISRSISTVLVSTTKLTTQTVIQNSSASTFEVALAALIGASIALLASILVILMRLRSRQPQPK